MTLRSLHAFAPLPLLGGTLLFGLFACDEPVEGFGPPSVGVGGASSVATTGEGGAAASTASATSAASTGSGVGGAPASLPFAVDDYFKPSGFMGDGETPGALEESAACPMRAGDAAGKCHRIDYTKGQTGWAGIYWQSPEGNWGTSEGLTVPTAPVEVSFYAWSVKGGEGVTFFAGGLGGSNTAYADTFKVEKQLTLTTTPTRYTLPIGALPHANVLGGFGWSAPGAASGALSFFIDDIQYRPAP